MGNTSNGIIAHLIIQIFICNYNKFQGCFGITISPSTNSAFYVIKKVLNRPKSMFYGHCVFHIQVIYLLTKWQLLYYCLISTSSSFWFKYWALHASKSKPKQLNQSVTITLECLRRTGCYNIFNETTSVIVYIYEVHSDIKMLWRYLN